MTNSISGTEEAQAVNVALLPCPHCGGTATLEHHQVAEDAMACYVSCTQCYAQTDSFEDAYAPFADAIAAWNRRSAPALPQDVAASEDIEEALRLAEVGEYLYNDCTYEYGDGYEEPLEFGVEWSWGQSKPDTYGQGQLLVEAVKWHADQAADGIETEATKLRRLILSQSAALASAREVMQWVEARLYGSPVNLASEIKERIRSVARGG